MRLRDLNITLGSLSPGPANAISDVPGVRVGHVDVVEGGLSTGITLVVPYGDGARRRVFAGRWSVDGGDGMTGLGVTEDFGVIATPVMLAPVAAVGRVYDGLIAHGRGMEPELWPPVVVGVDDSGANPPELVHRLVREEHLYSALTAAGGEMGTGEGSTGIGLGLSAFGVRGGVGTASRRAGSNLPAHDSAYTVGALVAVNGGEPGNLSVDGFPVGASLDVEPLRADLPRSLAAVVVTDAPLIPRQLDHLASRAAVGLARVGLFDARTRDGIVLALSTTGLNDTALPESPATRPVSLVGEGGLPPLYAAAAQACEEAVLNGLLQAVPLPDRGAVAFGSAAPRQSGHLSRTLPIGGWPQEVRRFQSARRRRGG